MRGFKRDHSARVIVRGHALMQNLRRGHYELGVDMRAHRRVEIAFTEPVGAGNPSGLVDLGFRAGVRGVI